MTKITQMLRWRAQRTSRRFATAWRYATGRATLTDGYDLLHAAESLTGIYGLETLSTYSLADDLVERYGEVRSAAEDWAGELVAEYAKEAGLELVDSWDIAA